MLDSSVFSELLLAVQRVYSIRCLPRYPINLTQDIAWRALRETWNDSNYWLSVEELLLIGCYNGPQLKVYRHRILQEVGAVFEELSRGSLPPLTSSESFERVVLSVDEESQCGQHFSKILTEDAWNSLQAARDEESDQSSDLEDDDSSSSSSVSETPVQETRKDDTATEPSTANDPSS
jgi:hypothetical protein